LKYIDSTAQLSTISFTTHDVFYIYKFTGESRMFHVEQLSGRKMFKFKNPSLITRIAVGKLTGLIIGLLGLVMIPFLMPETPMIFRVAILLWYITLGAIVGIYGIFTEHPIFKFKLCCWVRSSMIGAWMNLMVVLFAYEILADILYVAFGTNGVFMSPYWFVLEGALVGLIIEYFAKKYGGQGKETVKKDFK